MTLDEWSEIYVSAERRQRFRDVLAQRLDCLTLVFDHVGDPHNVSACVRVADSFGIGTVLNYSDGRYRRNRQISMHTDLWVDVVNLQQPEDVVARVRQQGYTLVGTVVGAAAGIPVDKLTLPPKTALVLGSEHDGISPEMRDACEHLVTIPTYGFADSLNISTAAAILTRRLSQAYRQDAPANLYLPAAEQERLYRYWVERDTRLKLRKRGISPD
jgi:tRNA (guanosine-2'-O-)-methyltransferase